MSHEPERVPFYVGDGPDPAGELGVWWLTPTSRPTSEVLISGPTSRGRTVLVVGDVELPIVGLIEVGMARGGRRWIQATVQVELDPPL